MLPFRQLPIFEVSKSISQKKGLKHENTTITTIKGQVISKALFGISILPKNERKKFDLTTMYDTSGRLVFVRFLNLEMIVYKNGCQF